MEELIQVYHSNKFENKIILIFMASIFSSVQADRNYTISDS